MDDEEEPTKSRIDLVREKMQSSVSRLIERTRSIRIPENWREKLESGLTHISPQNIREHLENFEPSAAIEWAGAAIQKRQNAGVYGKALTIILCAWFLADLSGLLLGKYVPEPPTNRSGHFGASSRRVRSYDDYNVIFARNLFNSKGIIPGEENPTGSGAPDLGGPPVKTTLPFNLIGTLILTDELRSIATIEDKSAAAVYPVRVEDEIPSKARIVKIEPRRVIFVNTATGRREYVELPEETSKGPVITLGSKTDAGPGIEKVAPTEFNISRSEVDNTLKDLNNVLTQARAVPNFENGAPNGYKLFQIVPGSIYDKLGLVNGDVIQGLNGQPINDPGKAFEMLNELKTSSHLDLQIKRDGKTSSYSYNIH